MNAAPIARAGTTKSAPMPRNRGEECGALRRGQMCLWTVQTDGATDPVTACRLQAIISADEQKATLSHIRRGTA